jgi:hypothetical protein
MAAADRDADSQGRSLCLARWMQCGVKRCAMVSGIFLAVSGWGPPAHAGGAAARQGAARAGRAVLLRVVAHQRAGAPAGANLADHLGRAARRPGLYALTGGANDRLRPRRVRRARRR